MSDDWFSLNFLIFTTNSPHNNLRFDKPAYGVSIFY